LASGGVERTGAVPDPLKNIPDGRVGQIFQPKRVRPVPDLERLVRSGCVPKVMIELKKIADIRDDDDRRNVLGIGQLAGILLSLLFGIINISAPTGPAANDSAGVFTNRCRTAGPSFGSRSGNKFKTGLTRFVAPLLGFKDKTVAAIEVDFRVECVPSASVTFTGASYM
jgi:hypothetical protein